MDMDKVLLFAVALVAAIKTEGRRAGTDTIDTDFPNSLGDRLQARSQSLALPLTPSGSCGEYLNRAENVYQA